MALLLAVCLVLRYMQTRASLPWTLAWLAASGVTLALTQSATVALSTAGCFVVLAGLVVQRNVPVRLRLRVVGIFTGIGVVAAIIAFFARHWIADAFGRSPDMSGRSVIWHSVAPLIADNPSAAGAGSSAGPRGSSPSRRSSFARTGRRRTRRTTSMWRPP